MVRKNIIATILGLLVLVGGLGAGVVLVKQQQDIREKAREDVCDPGQVETGDCTTPQNCPGYRERTCNRGGDWGDWSICMDIADDCPPHTPKPTPKPTKKTCSELGLDVADKNKRKRQCKCADCDVPGSELCVYDGKEYQCCDNDYFWAHGGCCDKNKVFCGCSSKFSGTLLFCNDNDKDLKPYGNVILKYPSRSGTCPIKLCP